MAGKSPQNVQYDSMLNKVCKTKAVGPGFKFNPDCISKPLKHVDIQGQSGLKSCLRTGLHADRDIFLEMLPFSPFL